MSISGFRQKPNGNGPPGVVITITLIHGADLIQEMKEDVSWLTSNHFAEIISMTAVYGLLSLAHYPPNDFGLYDIAGNVSEWTMSAYDPSSYNFTWDMNPNYTYNAKEDDPPAMKRKVIRGGSWKDMAYYMQVSTRDYEYQDTAKSYIGFRCILPYLGQK